MSSFAQEQTPNNDNNAFTTTLLCFSYTCSSQSEELTSRVKYSNKILLPPSVLYNINNHHSSSQTENNDAFNDVMFFKIKNLENEITEVCGVQEFSAPPGVVHIPYHIMEGKIIICLIDDSRKILKRKIISSKTDTKIFHIDPNIFHLIVPISKIAIWHEVSVGPFEKNKKFSN